MRSKAFKDWVQPLSNQLYFTALRMVVNREDARDIVQEAVLRLWEQKDRLESVKRPEAYAMRIVINLSLDWLKRHKPIYLDMEASGFGARIAEDPGRNMEYCEKLETVHRLVHGLPPLQKAIFELREIRGLTYREMADLLGVDIGVVKVNLHRMRKKLKEHCEKLDEYGITKN